MNSLDKTLHKLEGCTWVYHKNEPFFAKCRYCGLMRTEKKMSGVSKNVISMSGVNGFNDIENLCKQEFDCGRKIDGIVMDPQSLKNLLNDMNNQSVGCLSAKFNVPSITSVVNPMTGDMIPIL